MFYVILSYLFCNLDVNFLHMPYQLIDLAIFCLLHDCIAIDFLRRWQLAFVSATSFQDFSPKLRSTVSE